MMDEPDFGPDLLRAWCTKGARHPEMPECKFCGVRHVGATRSGPDG